jgi:hypothetical protein
MIIAALAVLFIFSAAVEVYALFTMLKMIEVMGG